MTTKYVRPVVRSADGTELPILFPPPLRARRVNGLFLIQQDLHFSMRGFQYLAQHVGQPVGPNAPKPGIDESEELVARSVWLASVVTYAKCFIEAEGRGIKLKRKDVESLGAAPLECHEKLLSNRHQYVAHAGQSLNEHSVFGLAVQNPSPLQLLQVSFVLQATLPSKEDCIAATQLCQDLSVMVQGRINDACDRLEADLRRLPVSEFAQLLANQQPRRA